MDVEQLAHRLGQLVAESVRERTERTATNHQPRHETDIDVQCLHGDDEDDDMPVSLSTYIEPYTVSKDNLRVWTERVKDAARSIPSKYKPEEFGNYQHYQALKNELLLLLPNQMRRTVQAWQKSEVPEVKAPFDACDAKKWESADAKCEEVARPDSSDTFPMP